MMAVGEHDRPGGRLFLHLRAQSNRFALVFSGHPPRLSDEEIKYWCRVGPSISGLQTKIAHLPG